MALGQQAAVTADDSPQKLFLAGYVPLMPHGFALPCFSTGPRSNTWYTAVCSIDADHSGRIVEFEIYEAHEIEHLPEAELQEVAVGDHWVDVFLWESAVLVGTADELLDALQDKIPEMRAHAPLTLLDLALHSGRLGTAEIARTAIDYLTAAFGADEAHVWLRDTLLRQRTMVALRHIARDAELKPTIRALISQTEIVDVDDGTMSIELPEALGEALAKADVLSKLNESLAALAEALDIGLSGPTSAVMEPDFAPPPRTEWDDAWMDRGSDVLIIFSGPRAERVARHVETPDWVPDWGSGSPYRVPEYSVRQFDSRRGWPDSSRRPTIDVADGRNMPKDFSAYGAIVWLADDDAITGNAKSRQYADVRRALTSGSHPQIRLLAPALPLEEPSDVLMGPPPKEPNFGFDTIIDTSIARSPFWSGNQRRSLDRRIADSVIGAAMLCAGDNPVSRHLTRNGRHDGPTMLTFAARSGQRADPLTDTAELASEASGLPLMLRGGHDDVALPFYFEMRNVARRKPAASNAYGQILRRRPRFQEFAEAVVDEIGHREAPKGIRRNRVGRDVPERLTASLRHPVGVATLRASKEGPSERLMVLAEAPSLETLRVAAEENWPVARYTDRDAIARIFKKGWSDAGSLPEEISLPSLHRMPGNRSFATRGLDPRDVIRLERHQYERWRFSSESTLFDSVRRYRASINRGNDELKPPIPDFVLPWADFQTACRQGDGGALALSEQLGLNPENPQYPPKRPGDLRVAWTVPDGKVRRFVIEDGQLPVALAEIDWDEVPSQRMFLFAGDASVPALLSSRLFAVWARATTSRSTSWMSRFSVSGTFETFPMPDAFEVQRHDDGPAQLRLRRSKDALERVIRNIDEDTRSSPPSEFDGERYLLAWQTHPLIETLDAAILVAAGLPENASDLQILDHLVRLNEVIS
ncbi:hypothetical protein [Sphingomonas bacterium]|uniref:hypothetical protein n=1 Tax=Sphingomonas bacterium TaxID=1895847 RepID=UPI0015754E59|nr:hypothetical protein [Sphingomonas bacterium]